MHGVTMKIKKRDWKCWFWIGEINKELHVSRKLSLHDTTLNKTEEWGKQSKSQSKENLEHSF